MKRTIVVAIAIAAFLALPMASLAGVKLKIAEDVNVDLGFRVQTQFLSSSNITSNSADESELKFNLRRARIRLGGNVTKWVKFFIQTEASGSQDTSGLGINMDVIDALINLHYESFAQLIMGLNMAPAGRQVTTSSGGLMTIDRPNITNFNLTWLLSGRANFNTSTFEDTNLGIDSDTSVRDLGATFFGSYDFSDMYHIKYYAGLYDGINADNEDTFRYTLRAQFNIFDSEPGYFNLSTYLGKKKTVGIGFSYDGQDEFATETVTDRLVDYRWWEVDLFGEYPIGPGTGTLELAFQDLDIDDPVNRLVEQSATSTVDDPKQTQGNGWYIQGGYFLPDYNTQIWGNYERWSSDGVNDRGSFDSFRIGLSYFFKGHNANVKAGYEQFKADTNIGSSSDDTIHTFLIGFYVTY